MIVRDGTLAVVPTALTRERLNLVVSKTAR